MFFFSVSLFMEFINGKENYKTKKKKFVYTNDATVHCKHGNMGSHIITIQKKNPNDDSFLNEYFLGNPLKSNNAVSFKY